jgi:hypothetical protein
MTASKDFSLFDLGVGKTPLRVISVGSYRKDFAGTWSSAYGPQGTYRGQIEGMIDLAKGVNLKSRKNSASRSQHQTHFILTGSSQETRSHALRRVDEW